MSEVVIERLVTQLVFQGDIAAYDRASITVAGLSEAAFTATVALTGLAASTAKEVTQYARLGEGLGIGTQGARELSAVFIALGSDANDVSDALQTVSDYALEAATGNKEWVKTFTAAGVNISNLRNKKPDEILEVVADGIASLGSAAERAAAASRIFGDDVGRKLLPLLVQGSEGIKRMREEARIFGGVITEEAAKSAMELEGDLRRLTYASQELRIRFGMELAPTLRLLTKDILDWVMANKEWVDMKLDYAADSLKHAFAALTGPIGLTVSAIGGLSLTAAAATAAFRALAFSLGYSAGGLAAALSPMVAPAGVLLLFVMAIEDLMYAAEGGPSVFGDLAKSIGVDSEFQAALKSMKTMLGEASDFAKAIGGNFAESVREMIAQIPMLETLQPYIQAFQRGTKYALKKVELSTESAARGYRKATDALERDEWFDNIDETLPQRTMGGSPSMAGTAHLTLGTKMAGYALEAGLGAYNWMAGTQIGTVNINASGLSAAEAETVVRNALDAEVRGANDAAAQGAR